MGIRTLLYLFRLGLKNLWHHRVYTAASVITMSACIFLFGLFYLAAANVDSMVKKTEQEVYVAVFFDEGILPERVEEIGNLIQSRPEVLRTVYVSADEAWSGFKEKYYENAEALDGIFETDNPLASSGNYQVYIDRIGSQEGFVEYVQSIEGVRKTTHSADTVMALLKLRQGAARLIAGSAVLLVLISVLLIHNTLSVGIEAQKEKTRVMRLMGAREGFVKIPFMAEAVVMGAAGVVIPLILLMWLYRWGLAFAVSGLNGLGSLRGLESGLLTEAQVFPGLIRGRTHTSSVQSRVMEVSKPPIRVICPGRVYRNEAISYRAHCFFHQVEGLYIDKNVSFTDLKQVLLQFAQEMFGPETKIRLRPSYFPFTEPSAEMDISCDICGGEGCPFCKYTGWVEILGCGMVDPAVLEANGIDSKVYTGYAFGMGVERIANLKYKVKDLRMFSENDTRFLEEFEAAN